MKYRKKQSSTTLLGKNTNSKLFAYPVFAANNHSHRIYGKLEQQRQQKEQKNKAKQKTRYKYQRIAKGFFGSSLLTDEEVSPIPPFTGIAPRQTFAPQVQNPGSASSGMVIVPPVSGGNTPDIILSISLLLSSPPIPLITLTMPLNAELSASITLPLNYYDGEGNISAIFAVAYTINANLIIAMAFPNDTYTHFLDPTVTLIFGLPINYMSGLSIPVAFGTEGPIYPVLIINPLATPENPESGDVVVPPEAPVIP